MPGRPKSPFSHLFRRLRAPLPARWSERLSHAFAMPARDVPLSQEEVDFLSRMADRVVQQGMAAPATLFLESVAPLNFLGSQVLHGLTPLLNLACGAGEYDRAARLLERRDSIARLVALIETKSAAVRR